MRFDCIHCRKATTKPQSVKGAFLRMLTVRFYFVFLFWDSFLSLSIVWSKTFAWYCVILVDERSSILATFGSEILLAGAITDTILCWAVSWSVFYLYINNNVLAYCISINEARFCFHFSTWKQFSLVYFLYI